MENKHGVNTPIIPSQTFPVEDIRMIADCFAAGMPKGTFIYGRFGHPNYADLSRRLLEMEGVDDDAHDVLLFGSGLAASFTLFFALLSPGDHIVASKRLYGGTRGQIALLAKKLRVKVSVVDVNDMQALEAALAKKRTKLLFTEVVSNPDLVVANVRRLAELAHAKGALLAVDNTFTPLIVRPLRLGADIVLHSLTKFVSGASDIMGGAIIGKNDLVAEILHPSYGAYPLVGAVLAPPDAQKLADRFDTLEYRVEKASKRARSVALLMYGRKMDVRYPVLNDDDLRLFAMGAQHAGAVVSVAFQTEEEGVRFTEALSGTKMRHEPFAIPAVSLGSAHTYVWCFTEARVKAMVKVTPLPFQPIPYGFVRIAVGYAGNDEEFIGTFASVLDRLGYK